MELVIASLSLIIGHLRRRIANDNFAKTNQPALISVTSVSSVVNFFIVVGSVGESRARINSDAIR
jgi:hypothetical protein